MRTIWLSTEEQELLKNILESSLSDIRMEIAGTENWEFKHGLHERKALIIHLLEKIQAIQVEDEREVA